MLKTIFLAALLSWGIATAAQPTYFKVLDGGLLLSATPLSSGKVLGNGFQTQFFAPNVGLVALFDTDGELLWRKRIPSLNFVRYSLELSDGYLILGDSTPTTGPLPRPQYGVVAKLNTAGQVIWARKIDGYDLLNTPISSILPVPDGYVFFVRGHQAIKIDALGNTVWSKKYSTDYIYYDALFYPQLVQGDTLFAVGHIQGNAGLLRIDVHTGELFGWASFGGIFYEEINSLRPTQDGNFMVAGSTRTTTGSEEDRPWIVKINREGQVIWSKTYNIIGTNLVFHLAETQDGNFVLASGTGNFGNVDPYAILAKMDQSGNLLWANNYSGGQNTTFVQVGLLPDGGFWTLGSPSCLLKTDRDGRVSNGCCPAPVSFQVEPFMPPQQTLNMKVEDAGLTSPFFPLYETNDLDLSVQNFCELPITSVIEQFQVCQGDSIAINGVYYQAPYTLRDTVKNLSGGCDTVRVYNLTQIPLPFRAETIFFCPGTTLSYNGNSYTQPDTLQQILPATAGCDTLLLTFLQWRALPKKYQTTTFCPGDVVYFDGIGYSYPGVIPFPDTLPGPANGCDTLLYQVLEYPSEPSSVTVVCPPNRVVNTAPGTPPVVQYPMPSATSTCSCPETHFYLQEGLPSGSVFPIGDTKVCYSAYDICGDYKTCCFEVKVQEEDACDVKETSCVRFELLGVREDAELRRSYQLRVTNHCTSPLVYAAIQIPDGVDALSPVHNSTYTAPNGNTYTVRNPSLSPFRSVRYKSTEPGIANDQSDVFEYTLPAQANPTFIRAAARLASGVLYEATLNTFDCAVPELAQRSSLHQPTSKWRIYPNPSNGELFIEHTAMLPEAVSLRVLSVDGKDLWQTYLWVGADKGFVKWPETLPDGLYFLEIRTESGEKHLEKWVLRR